MTGGFLTRYAQDSVPPAVRAGLFVEHEPRLTWVSLLFADFPNADVYLVGGTLRDVILGISPKDIDLVIRNITPEKLEQWLRGHGAASFVGKRFGTFKFTPHGQGGSAPIDIALPRIEQIADVHFSGRSDLDVSYDYKLPIKNDLGRRDFTMNAIAYDIRRKYLVDPFNGLEDLANGVIRAVGAPSERFFEDATRMLRALRFASQRNFSIEGETWAAIKDFIHLLNNTRPGDEGKHVYSIPREAIGKEFLLGYSNHPIHTLELWNDAGALALFLPEVARLKDVTLSSGKNAFEATLRILHLLHKQSFLNLYKERRPSTTLLAAAMFVFVDDDRPREGAQVCKRLFFHQFSSDHDSHVDCKRMNWILSHLETFHHEDPATIAPSRFEKMFCTTQGYELMMLAHTMFITEGEHSAARERFQIARRILEDMHKICPKGEKLPHLVSGSDIEALGIPPGPVYRELKNKIRDAQLDGEVKTKEEAIDLLRTLVKDL